MLIYEISRKNRQAAAQRPAARHQALAIPEALQRKHSALLPAVSELQMVRHYTNLSRKNFAIDLQFYPLGSCTMKYNPRGAHKAASHPDFLRQL